MEARKIKVGSDCSGIGSFIQALKRLSIDYKESFACDFDYYARLSYVANYGTKEDLELANSKEHKKHADTVKNISLGLLVSNKEEELLREANEFAKKFSFYFPFNMYQREVPKTPLDVYTSTVPCQAFSLAGKRKGEDDKRGVLFYNSHEFIQKNKPRYFIFENVKGLLSDDNGKTFQRWLDFLGGKSVNGNPVIFPHEESVPYHIYWKVLNAKHYGVPQNRERVFIVGIRDDADNDFNWPKPFPLTKKLKDVLEENVDEKYFLSDKSISQLLQNNDDINHLSIDKVANTLRVGGGGSTSKKHSYDVVNVGNTNPSGNGMNGNVFDEDGICPTLTTNKGEGIKIKSATSKGYETATENDSINFSQPNSETRRGRVGKEVAQTLDTNCQQGVMIGAFRGRNPENPKSREKGDNYEQKLEVNKDGVSNTLSTVQKDNVVIMKQNYCQWDASGKGYDSQQDRAYYEDGVMGTLAASNGGNKHNVMFNDYKIRRLTERECLRLMDFPDSFKIVCSATQTYKQAGNSIVVSVLANIISKLKL